MHAPEPTAEHLWLQRLVGNWTMETQCTLGPGQPPMKTTGRETVRSLGNLWVVGESKGQMPNGGSHTSIITLGFDARQQRFVGSFVASMMQHLWIYNGSFDAAGKVLTLDTEGPSFADDGSLNKYQDILEFLSDDHRTLSSRTLGPDGNWFPFMVAHYHRQK